MLVTASGKCRRCGTLIRNNRVVCPSCGLDLNEPAPSASKSGSRIPSAPERAPRKPVAAKTGVKMCQICMASVPEDQLADVEGQKICPTCAENMKTKAAKKNAPEEKK